MSSGVFYSAQDASSTSIWVYDEERLTAIDVNGVIVLWPHPDTPGPSGVREPRRPAPTAGPTAEAAA